MDISTPENVLRSYATRDTEFEEDSGHTHLGQKNDGNNTRNKITHIEGFGFGIIGTALCVRYGTWVGQPATLVLMRFNFRSNDGALRLKGAEISISFENLKRADHTRPPVLRYFYPQGKQQKRLNPPRIFKPPISADIKASPTGPCVVNGYDNGFSITGRAWSSKKRDDFHQVFWKINEAGNAARGLPDELNLVVVVEHCGPFQGIVEVNAKSLLGQRYLKTPWSADDPLLFDGITEKGKSPSKLEFDAMVEEDWMRYAREPNASTSSFAVSDDIKASLTSKSSENKRPADKVYRLRGIPYHFRSSELAKVLESSDSLGIEYGAVVVHSFSDYPYLHEKVAIVSFPEQDSPFEINDDRDEWEVSYEYHPEAPILNSEGARLAATPMKLVFDTHFRGFTTLGKFVGGPKHKIDLIAVSGLGGHAFGSFKERGGPYMWLQDSLATDPDLPSIRILIYGYDTKLRNSHSFQTITDLAGQFQSSLRTIRTGIAAERPLIFIGHSLGGLIIKQAMIHMADGDDLDHKNLKATYGALFFGVPNRGMDIKSLIPMVEDQPNKPLLESLGKNSEFLRVQAVTFTKAFSFPDSQILSFYETIESPTAKQEGGKWKMVGESAVLVDMFSATHSRAWENDQRFILAINKNHSNLVKFSRYDEDYFRVRSYLLSFIREAETVVRRRFQESCRETM